MKELTKDHIELFNDWLVFYSDENKDATCTGIYKGVRFALESLGIYSNVTFSKTPSSFEVNDEKIRYLTDKIKKNSINAMLNLGFASGIAWVLEEFKLYEIK